MTPTDISMPDEDGAIQCVFSCNDAFCQHMAVSIASLLENNTTSKIHLHIVHSGLSRNNIENIKNLAASYQNSEISFYFFDISPYRHFRVDGHITLQSYLRLFLADILPAHIRRVIYLDSDLVVLQPVDALWRADIGQNMIAATPDPFSQSSKARLGLSPQCTYVNAGVLVIDLEKWRKGKVGVRFLHVLEKDHSLLRFHDQDVLNLVFSDAIALLEPKWNFQARARRKNLLGLYGADFDYDALRNDIAIVHFTTNKKPWNYRDSVPFEEEYMRYIELTPWRGFVQHGRTSLNAVMRHVDGPLETLNWQVRKLKMRLGLEARHS